MPQAEEICDHVVMIHRGQKVLDDPVSSILRPHDSRALKFEPLDARADVERGAGFARASNAARRPSGGYEVALREGADAARVMQSVIAAVPVARIELKRPTLEDVFVAIVAGGDRARPPRAEERRRMNKVWQIAVREFVATVFTKGFIIGLLIVPDDRGADGRLRAAVVRQSQSHGRGGDRRRRSDGRRATACSRGA